MKNLFNAKHKTSNKIVKVFLYNEKNNIPTWCERYLCEDKYLFYMPSPWSSDIQRVHRGDCFIYDNEKVYFVKKKDFSNLYEKCSG